MDACGREKPRSVAGLFDSHEKMCGETMIACSRAGLFGLAFLASLFCLAGLAGAVTPSSAADYPDRPVRWVIGFPAGGPVDTVARIMSQALSEHFGQQFVVENRAGSGGNIAISASLYKKLPFDFIRDTVPVAFFTEVPNLLVVSNAMPVETVQELI